HLRITNPEVLKDLKGVAVEDLEFIASSVKPGTVREQPAVYRKLQAFEKDGAIRTRVDPDPDLPEPLDDGGYLLSDVKQIEVQGNDPIRHPSAAVIHQSDAEPQIDQRKEKGFDYYKYFHETSALTPTHLGDSTAAELNARFRNIGFELA